jgi:hypothetical protein
MLLVAGAIMAPALAVGPLAKPAYRALKAIVDVAAAYRIAPVELAAALPLRSRPDGVSVATLGVPGERAVSATVDAVTDGEAWLSASFLSQSMSLSSEGDIDIARFGASQYGSHGRTGAPKAVRRGASGAGGGTSGGSGVGAPQRGNGTSGKLNPQQATTASMSDTALTAIAQMLTSDADTGAKVLASLGVSDVFSAPASPSDPGSLPKPSPSPEAFVDAVAGNRAGVPAASPVLVPAVLTAGDAASAPLAGPHVDSPNARIQDSSAAVPEPLSLILLGTGATALLGRARRGRAA